MSEDLSEGEKGDAVGDLSSHGESNRGRFPRISSVDIMEAWVNQQKGKKLYIILIRYEINAFAFCSKIICFILLITFISTHNTVVTNERFIRVSLKF